CDLVRVAHRFEIVVRLAHDHHYDVGDEALALRRQALAARARGPEPIAEAITRDHDLADDLAGREIAHKALGAGVTERTRERAADLTGNAKRAAVGLGDVDAFDLVRPFALARLFAGQPQQPFARAVDRDLLGHHVGAREREM